MEKVRFRFRGSLHQEEQDCPYRGQPHTPHVVGHYDTVVYGQLDYFCLGREGAVDGGTLKITVEDYSRGCPEVPGRASGWYVVEP